MKRMLIASDEEESRVAIIDSKRLENLEIETKKGGEGRRGNVYKGVVHKVEQSLQAAFIDFGEDKQGFLPLSEIHRRLWPKGITDKRPDITKLLREKQELMVQVVKDEIGTKGATLTTYVSLPGRYMVLMPESEKHGISRRLSDAERRRMKETIDSIGVPDGFGVIIRTAGQQQRPLELKKDLLYLTKLYDTIEDNFGRRKNAGLIYKDRSHAVRFIRDYFSEDIEEIWVDSRSVLKEISQFMGVLMPASKERLRLYEHDTPLFVKFAVEDQVESVFARQVQLPGGGSIVLDQTEALVAVDVNSGRVKGEDIEETALKTNLEAADEVARQVRIRDLGGLIVVDFIDMRERKNVRAVEQRVRAAFADDKAKIKFGRISAFGLMELSRQRLRKALASAVSRRCPACDGTGTVRAPASAALSLLRRIEEACLRGNVKYVRATCPVAIANVLLNRRRRELMELEQKRGIIVEVAGHKEMRPNLVALDIVVVRSSRAAPQRIYQLLDMVRNDIVRKEQSPLPKPEDGLEALDLDHAAIYAAITERDAILRAQEELENDFEFAPREPEPAEEASRPKRKRKRHKDPPPPPPKAEPVREKVAAPAARASARVAPPTTVAPTPEPKKSGGFMAWLKRMFGGGEPEVVVEVAPMPPITDEAVQAAEEVEKKRRAERGDRDDDDGRRRRRSRNRGGRDRRDRSDRDRGDRDRGDRDRGDRDRGGSGRDRSERRDRSDRGDGEDDRSGRRDRSQRRNRGEGGDNTDSPGARGRDRAPADTGAEKAGAEKPEKSDAPSGDEGDGSKRRSRRGGRRRRRRSEDGGEGGSRDTESPSGEGESKGRGGQSKSADQPAPSDKSTSQPAGSDASKAKDKAPASDAPKAKQEAPKPASDAAAAKVTAPAKSQASTPEAKPAAAPAKAPAQSEAPRPKAASASSEPKPAAKKPEAAEPAPSKAPAKKATKPKSDAKPASDAAPKPAKKAPAKPAAPKATEAKSEAKSDAKTAPAKPKTPAAEAKPAKAPAGDDAPAKAAAAKARAAAAAAKARAAKARSAAADKPSTPDS